jgi:hypothetical protein
VNVNVCELLLAAKVFSIASAPERSIDIVVLSSLFSMFVIESVAVPFLTTVPKEQVAEIEPGADTVNDFSDSHAVNGLSEFVLLSLNL